MKVYLCGGINGLCDADCRNWREIAKSDLKHETLDPMRRDYRGREDQCVDEIVAGDEADIRECDVLLVNAVRPSWGTAMEVFMASRIYGKPVFTACPSTVSPWLRKHSTKVFTTLSEAIEELNKW